MCLVKNHTEASFKESNFSPLNGSSYTSSLVSFDVTWLSFVPEIRSFDKHYYYCQRKRKNMKNKTSLKWIIMHKNSFIVHANCSNYDDRVWKALGQNWCSVPFSVMSSAILNLYADYRCTSSPRLATLDNTH